jgi:cytochrome c biogenesis protein CcmG/thiol:disulfide interchange protein DsbE
LIRNSYSLDVNSEASGRRTLPALLALGTLAIALLAAGCGGSDAGNPDSRLSLEQAQEPLKGAPPPLAEIRTQANELLGGGTDAFDTRLGALRGYPVVVNKWASWCGPCRFEFPYFQSVAAERGGEIAFLGVDSNDSDSAAEQFLSELPLPFPSYSDPNLEIAQQFDGPPQAFPATAFYDRSGKLVYTHLGPYRGEEDLIADVNRYAG